MKNQRVSQTSTAKGLQSAVCRLQSSSHRRRTAGFTLLELMTVMLIMFIMMGVASVSLRGVVRGAGVSGAVSNVRAVLTQARQNAIIKQQETYVKFRSGATNDMQISVRLKDWETGSITTNYAGPFRSLPEGIEFGSSAEVAFKPDGSAKVPLNNLQMRQRNAPLGAAAFTIQVTQAGKISIN